MDLLCVAILVALPLQNDYQADEISRRRQIIRGVRGVSQELEHCLLSSRAAGRSDASYLGVVPLQGCALRRVGYSAGRVERWIARLGVGNADQGELPDD